MLLNTSRNNKTNLINKNIKNINNNKNIINNKTLIFNLFSFISQLTLATTTINSQQKFLSENCGFHSKNYSIKWAYEPKSGNVVFVMKIKLPPTSLNNNVSFDLIKQQQQQKTSQKMLTGIAFGDKDQLDFIGISSINDQLDLVSGHGEWRLRQEDDINSFFTIENELNRPSLIRMSGPLRIINGGNNNNNNNNNENNNNQNVASIRAISLKKQTTDGSIIAEFARPLSGDGEQLKTDLSKCTNFFLITKWIKYNTNDENEKEKGGELPSILTTSSVSVRRTVCALVDECTLDINQIIINQDNEEKNQKKMKDLPPAASSPELAQSVDISGKGDPCRFNGLTYSIEWWLEDKEEIVYFLMKQKSRKGKWWSAVGIGDNMSDMDIGTIFLENGEPKAIIDYFSNSYNLPIKDIKQDWKLNKKLSKWPNKLFIDENNSEDVELYFSRKLNTDDVEKDRTLDGCVLFQFGANLGEYGPPGFRLNKHKDWPDLYKACDIKKHCTRQKTLLQNGGNDMNIFVKKVNIPTLSHSTDENKTLNNDNKFNETDKAIGLLMKSLGPKIVETVSESEREKFENLTNKIKIEKKGQKEEINEENTEKATIIPLLFNSNQTNVGIQISEGDDVFNETNENKLNKNIENNKTSIIIPLTKRQEQQQTLEQTLEQQKQENVFNNNSIETINNETIGIIGGSSLSSSPFSLSAFLGGGEQQQQQLNLNNNNSIGENGVASTASIIRQSGEVDNSTLENLNITTQASPPRFGISQMLQEEKEEENKNNKFSLSLTNLTTNNETNNLLNNSINNLLNNETNSISKEINLNITNNDNQTIATTTIILPTNTTETKTEEIMKETTKNINENSQTSTGTTNISSSTNNVLTTTEISENNLLENETETNNLNNTTNEIQEEQQTSETTLSTLQTISETTSNNSETNKNTTNSEEIENTTNKNTLETISSTTVKTETEETTKKATTQKTHPTTNENITTKTSKNVYLTSKTTTEKLKEETNNRRNIATNLNVETTTKTLLSNTEIIKNTSISNEHPEEQGIKLPIASSKCDALRPDLPICRSYMDTYIERVKDWSERHGEPLERQYPKACRLLSAVPHVPTLCCQLFTDRCADFV